MARVGHVYREVKLLRKSERRAGRFGLRLLQREARHPGTGGTAHPLDLMTGHIHLAVFYTIDPIVFFHSSAKTGSRPAKPANVMLGLALQRTPLAGQFVLQQAVPELRITTSVCVSWLLGHS